MSEITDAAERLKRIVESDADGRVNAALRVAQSDVMAVLCEFMDVSRLDMRVEPLGAGYRVTVTADADAIYGVGKIDAAY